MHPKSPLFDRRGSACFFEEILQNFLEFSQRIGFSGVLTVSFHFFSLTNRLLLHPQNST